MIFVYCLDCTINFQKQFSFMIKIHRKYRNGYSAIKIKLKSIEMIKRMRNSLWQHLIFENGYCLKLHWSMFCGTIRGNELHEIRNMKSNRSKILKSFHFHWILWTKIWTQFELILYQNVFDKNVLMNLISFFLFLIFNYILYNSF